MDPITSYKFILHRVAHIIRITGGSCGGGDSLKAYDFIHKYKLADDTCAPFMGVDSARGFTVSDMVKVADVQAHQCYLCMWSGTCTFVRR